MSTPYRPAWWLSNPHFSTVWGKFFRGRLSLPARVESWVTPDGDSVDVVRLDGRQGQPTFLLLHGLEGGPNSHYAAGALLEAYARGWSANLLVFRTCNGQLNRTRRSYHSGETSDVDMVIRRLLQERPLAPLVVAGVSLGGNVLLKWLGEQSGSLIGRVAAATAVSVPFDLARSCAQMELGVARLYGWNFLKTLKRKALRKLEQFPGMADGDRIVAAQTLWEFDDAFTAPIHGFLDAADYYSKCSSIHFLHRIRVPTLLLSARDDPFHPPEVLNDAARIAEGNPALHVEFVEQGGHVGFIEGATPWSARWYAERRMVEFAAELLERSESLSWEGVTLTR